MLDQFPTTVTQSQLDLAAPCDEDLVSWRDLESSSDDLEDLAIELDRETYWEQ